VGATDAVLDIVGGVEGFEQLGVTEIYHLPVAVGSGWVRTHGTLPVRGHRCSRGGLGRTSPVSEQPRHRRGVAQALSAADAARGAWRSGWSAGTRGRRLPNALRL
jgi:hypothetical protein